MNSGWSRLIARRAWCLIVALSIAAPLSRAAHAGPTPADRDTARALMVQGDAEFDQKDYAGALRAYQAAHAIMHVATTGLAVARALAARGLLVEALDMAIQVAHMPPTPGEPGALAAARGEADHLARDLEPRIGAIRISLEGVADPATARVQIDGLVVPAEVLNLPWSANPGRHVVRGSAPGRADDEKVVTVESGQAVGVFLVLPPEGAAATAASMATATAHEKPPRVWTPRRVTAAVMGGAGVLAVAVAGGLAITAKWNYDQAPGCDATGCDGPGYDARNAARSLGNVASVCSAVGAAALAASAVLWFTGAPGRSAWRIGVEPGRAVAEVSF